ncbi:adaptin N terminal region-domain-containing protein [Lactarius quietus]|nr:adaptin N terminal region-domain-containing protein [Lactarius quietus]
MELKAGAVLKLTYKMLLKPSAKAGDACHDMSWASFHVVEVMSSPKYHLKTVGYLAATQSFGPDTDVLMLTTNLLKKDLTSNPNDIAVSLNGLSNTVSPDLARDLSNDVVTMLSHSRPNIRKRAVIAVYKALIKYPEAAPFALTRLTEKLEDQDLGVVAATINVLCELVRREPRDYLSLAPQLFRLMTTSSNNWMLIKLIKLFGFLSPHEPRLVKKLQPPITELISTTPAISLLYECVHTCIVGGMLLRSSGDELAELCVTKLAAFLQDPDQNLKYIALLALVKIVPTHRHLDFSIRMRSLDLLSAMVTKDSLQSIVQQLLSYCIVTGRRQLFTSPEGAGLTLSPTQLSSYRLTLVQRLLEMCSHDTYDNIVDFQWYLSVLLDLTYVASVNVVKAVKRWAVELMTRLLRDDTFLANSQEEGSCAEVLWAAAWICASSYLLQPDVSLLASETIGAYLQAAIKLFGTWSMELSQDWDSGKIQDAREVVDALISRLKDFTSHSEIEVQERAANAVKLFTFIQADLVSFHLEDPVDGTPVDNTSQHPAYPKSLLLINPLFSAYEMNSVNSAAQESISVPEGLDLDVWIVPPPQELSMPAAAVADDSQEGEHPPTRKKVKGKAKVKSSKVATIKPHDSQADPINPPDPSETEERIENERRRLERMELRRHDPYYIPDRPYSVPSASDVDSIPVVRLDDLPPPPQETLYPSLLRDFATTTTSVPFVVDKNGEMPEVATQPASSGVISSSPAYVLDEQIPRPGTPEPIKVKRTKKKRVSTAKSKRADAE